MINCFLCNSSADLIPGSSGAHDYIQCKTCGYYRISFVCRNLINEKNKFIVSSFVFQNYYYKKNIVMLTSDEINQEIKKFETIKSMDKIYLLAKYIYSETLKLGVGATIENISHVCCYARNKDELFEYLVFLKKHDLIDFFVHDNGNCRVYGDVKMLVTAYTNFEAGVEGKDQFMEMFMKKPENIHIENYQGNVSLGSNNYQNSSNVNGVTETEIIKKLLNQGVDLQVIDSIRNELKEFVIEYNNKDLNVIKTTSILSKIKKISGDIVLNGLLLLAKPEIFQIIENVKKLI